MDFYNACEPVRLTEIVQNIHFKSQANILDNVIGDQCSHACKHLIWTESQLCILSMHHSVHAVF